MRAAVGHSASEDPHRALAEVLGQLQPALDGPADFALVFATSELAEDARELAEGLGEALGRPALVGGSTTAVISPSGEHEERPGLGVLALRGVRARARLATCAADVAAFAREPKGLRLAFPDPRRFEPEVLRAVFAAPGPLAGAGLAGRGNALFAMAGGAVGEVPCALGELSGVRAQVAVAQGAEPAGSFTPITRSRRCAVLELGGQPAALALRAHLKAHAEDSQQLANLLFVALRQPGAAGYAVRPIVGVDAQSGAVQLPDAVEPGDELAFAWRNTVAAVRDLKRVLAEVQAPGQVRAALYFNCAGRGQGLHLEPDADLHAIRAALPGVPLLGMSASFELGPVDGASRLLMYSGVLVTLRDV